jgi:glycosyltransferase involved in cell wall biosynthesis
MKPETLIILTPGFPANEADSIWIPSQQTFVKALQETAPALNIIILTFQYPHSSAEYSWNGIRVISFGSNKDNRIYRKFAGIKIWLALRKLHKEHQIIGLLSFWFGKCAYIGNLFAKKNGLKHYSWILGQDAKTGNKYFKMIKPGPEQLIGLSDFIVREFKKNYGVKPAHMIPVGIDKRVFSHGETKRDIDILGAGSLIPLKQYDIFLEMIHFLKAFKPDIKAVLCGGGIEERRLKNMAERMGLAENITFLGIIQQPEVLAMMQRSKIFLHPSSYEGFGTVNAEALYAGAHVMSFVRPMDREIKNWHHANNKEEMANKLKELLTDRKLRHEHVLPYPAEEIAKAMLRLFDYNDEAISWIREEIASKESVDLK